MFKKISDINELSDIRGTVINKITLEKAKAFIKDLSDGDETMYEVLLNNMSDEQILQVLKSYAEKLNARIEQVILEKAGQKKIPVGTKVTIQSDFGASKAGGILSF